jgi:hypothetical protein
MATINTPPTEPNPEADKQFLREKLPSASEQPVVKGLSAYIASRWATIQEDFKPVRRDMMRQMKRVRGEYTENKMKAIKAFRGSEFYGRFLENKARAAESWIKDIYRGDTDLPWVLEPTAVPDLPASNLEAIERQTQMKAMEMQEQIIATGAVPNPEEIAGLMQKYYDQELQKAKDQLTREAVKKVDAAATEIRDQSQEGGWDAAFEEFLFWFTRVKFGILKGPILVKRPKNQWQALPDGTFALQTVDVLVNDVYAPSPFNVFFAREMVDVDDGDVIEIHELTPETLTGLRDVDGYSNAEIDEVIARFNSGKLKEKWFTLDDESQVRGVTKEIKQDTGGNARDDATLKTKKSGLIRAMEFSGSVSGQLLIEWGIQGEVDPKRYYQANCWKIDKNVIKAVINPDPKGRKPYSVSSWAKNPAWIVGEGLIEFGGPIEDSMNAVMRALQNNVAIASGPMCEIDGDRVDENIPIYPWRQIKSTAIQMRQGTPAVNYYQPQMHAQELTLVFQFLGKLLDEMTVPAYAQGASQSGVTAGTATVFTQLLAAASRAIKAVVANIDRDIITRFIQMSYDYNMKNTKDESTKGDARVVAKGVSGLQAKEQSAQRKVEYLQVVANPTFQQMLGEKNIGSILLQLAKSNDIKLPDEGRLNGEQDLDAILQQMLMAQAGVDQSDPMQENGQVAQGGGAPKKAQGMNPDGSKAGVSNG